MKEAHVIGAGITGLTTSYELVKRGYKVKVFEEERYLAQKCSYANGGQLSVSNSEVWNTWSNVKKGVKWMFKKDAPLYIKPSLELAKIKWVAKFLWYTLSGVYAINTITTIKLGLQSREIYKKIIKDESIEFDASHHGLLHFYKNTNYFNDAKNVQDLYEYNGCQWTIVDDIKTIDPALSSIQNTVGGVITPLDWSGDIYKFCVALSSVLKNKYGVEFIYNQKVDTLVKCDVPTIICAGVGSQKLSKTVGDNLSIYPVKGYSITINDCDDKKLPKVTLLDDEAKIVASAFGNRFRVAGTAELAGENYDITRSRIEPLLKWTHENFPELDCSNYTQWACLRPMTPNMLPVVKQSKKNKMVFYNTGHGHLGWTLAPATALQIVDIIESVKE